MRGRYLRIVWLVLLAVSGRVWAGGDAVGVERGVTNVLVVSQTVEKRAWKRTAIMADTENRPLDPSGKLAAYADAAAAAVMAGRAGEISEGALAAIREAVAELIAVTNQVQGEAVHVAVSLPAQGSRNLQGMVTAEGCADGTNEWQDVVYSQALRVPPARRVEYVYPGGTASVEVVWSRPWDQTGLVHRCAWKRPGLLSGVRAFRTRRHDIFGGRKGFSFGKSLVTVDGIPTVTGSVTNSATGAVLSFENGVVVNGQF